MPPNYLILCHPLLLLPSIFPSIKGLFQWVGSLHQMAKYWSFSFSTSTSNEYSGLISFRIDCFSLQSKGLWKDSSSEPPFERINSLALRFLSGPPLTSTHDYQKNQLSIQIFVGKMMSLTLNMLVMFVIAFVTRSKFTFPLIPCCRWFLIPKSCLITLPVCSVYD